MHVDPFHREHLPREVVPPRVHGKPQRRPARSRRLIVRCAVKAHGGQPLAERRRIWCLLGQRGPAREHDATQRLQHAVLEPILLLHRVVLPRLQEAANDVAEGRAVRFDGEGTAAD